MAGGAGAPNGSLNSFLTEAPDDNSPPAFARGTLERARDAAPTGGQDGSMDSGRRKVLVEEAELRAEQQALARLTMLDLAKELVDGAKRHHATELLLVQERQDRVALEFLRDALQSQLRDALRDGEEAKVAHARDRLHTSMARGCFLPAALLWSRIVVPIQRLASEISEEDTAILAREAAQEEDAKTYGFQLAMKRSKGDSLMLRWLVKSWLLVVPDLRRQRLQEEAEEERRKVLLAEMEKLKEAHERELTKEKSKSRGLASQLQAMVGEVDLLKKRLEQLEQDKAHLSRQLKPGEDLSGALEEARRRAAELELRLVEREALVDSLKQATRELEATLVKQREEFSEEKSRLKAELRDISAELQRQIIFAKHLRDVALKAKRDAAGSISPEKFAQLISELEDMRDKLNVLGSDHDRERDQCSLLRMKLEQNRRRLELERQFLPLLHKVRGPVGPKNPLFQKTMAAAAAAAMVPDEMGLTMGATHDRLPVMGGDSPGHQGTMRSQRSRAMTQSHSMGTLDGMPGARSTVR